MQAQGPALNRPIHKTARKSVCSPLMSENEGVIPQKFFSTWKVQAPVIYTRLKMCTIICDVINLQFSQAVFNIDV